jgi:hypothetical protein
MCFVNEKAVEKKWDYKGLQLIVTRTDLARPDRTMKHRCGYVRIPPGHAWHDKSYDDIPADVHGGLTFAEREACVHEDGVGYWIGFDCAHCGDSSFPLGDPDAARYGLSILSDGHYWLLPEVQKETESLADQVLEVSQSGTGTEI